jgi:hypothetical protein
METLWSIFRTEFECIWPRDFVQYYREKLLPRFENFKLEIMFHKKTLYYQRNQKNQTTIYNNEYFTILASIEKVKI